MKAAIDDIRALLLQFCNSGLKDFYVRRGELEVFLARHDGAANPMLAAPAPAAAPAAEERPAATIAVDAPHLGLFEPCCAVGDVVVPGALLARIDVLGRKTEVTAGVQGRVAALGFGANDLVQYGDCLVELAA